jgi:MFS transporter, ACS family, hexuronate transporter
VETHLLVEGLQTAARSARWRICALLFAATTLNYIDRQVLGVLAPQLAHVFGWTEADYGYIVAAFTGAYAIGLLGAGALIDRLGTRIGYALAIGIWSLAAMSHALARTVLGFAIARFFLGLGESGNFPAAVKTVAEWFPSRERALATGIFNAGSNIGAILAPLAVPIVAALWGLRASFLFTGVLSAIWVVTWLLMDDPHGAGPASGESVDQAQRAKSVASAARASWLPLLQRRQTWAFVAGKLLTDPVWWFLLFWLPKFLNARYGLNLAALGPPLIAVYLLADVGSVGGGWLTGHLARRGSSIHRARKLTMLLCALAVVPVAFASQVAHLWAAVTLIGIAAAAHQGWSANLYALASDVAPSAEVASVVGIGGFAGAASGMVVSPAIGWWLDATGSYVPVFAAAASAYLLALAVIQGLVPHLARTQAQA